MPVQMSPDGASILNLISGGFELFVPPTSFAQPPHCKKAGCFVMLDDKNDKFYNIDYETAILNNKTSWADLELHKISEPAIVFPKGQLQLYEEHGAKIMMKGYLVSIQSHEAGTITAKHLGSVFVKELPQESMNWGALNALKGETLVEEMEAGLLTYVWDRRPGAHLRSFNYVTPRSVLDGMTNPWHRDGDSLKWELDGQFAGGKRMNNDQKWSLIT